MASSQNISISHFKSLWRTHRISIFLPCLAYSTAFLHLMFLSLSHMLLGNPQLLLIFPHILYLFFPDAFASLQTENFFRETKFNNLLTS